MAALHLLLVWLVVKSTYVLYIHTVLCTELRMQVSQRLEEFRWMLHGNGTAKKRHSTQLAALFLKHLR